MEALLRKWTGFVARWPTLIIAFWIIAVAVAWYFGPSITNVAATQNNTSSLPTSALSRQADHIYATKFSDNLWGASKETDLLILTNPQGISSADIAHAEQIETWLRTTHPEHFLAVAGPGVETPAGFFESSDHQALRLILTWDTANTTVLNGSMQTMYTYLAQQHAPTGGFLGITGNAPISYDLDSSVFNTGSGLKLASLLGLLIILVVLGLVYRSPLAVLVPLIAVGLALGLAIPLIALMGQVFGIAVASFSLQYVAFVLLGAGTNYGVFMLSRYREEIRRTSSDDSAFRQAALARTVGHVGESIISSASTVVVAMAIMGFAQLYELRVTGPAIAIGVVCLLLAGLSLLPALMALCGKALFWPVQPRPGTLTDTTASQKGFWAAAGRLVTTHPIIVVVLTAIALVPLAISAMLIQPSFDDLKSIPASSPSIQAFNMYDAHFSDAAQVKVIFNDPGNDLRSAHYSSAISQVSNALFHVQHVTNILSPATDTVQRDQNQYFAHDGSGVVLTLTLNVDPYSTAAQQTVDAIYATAAHAQRSTAISTATVLISGQSSMIHDEVIQFGSDFTLVVILVCLAIYLILALLVRSVTAPVYLLATIALSAMTAVGIANLVFNVLLGEPLFSIVPIFAFVFLVSLGEDFNILTIARIREEVQKLGHTKGIATAIALTGGTVSSCGLVMAASFSRLVTNAVVEIAELGFTVVVGILLDTFIVRPLLVPAIATLLGRWNWVWPGSSLFQRSASAGASSAAEIQSADAVAEAERMIQFQSSTVEISND